jgi:L-alanine-DL-glutamate epimerase-like enolase superfamily enzyme
MSTTPIHTGEQIYLRQNFKELIEGHLPTKLCRLTAIPERGSGFWSG